jgi:hypothetical protein
MVVEEFGLEILGKDVVKVEYEFQLSTGFWCKANRDKFGYILSYKNSTGYWCESTRDKFGNELSYKSSNRDK